MNGEMGAQDAVPILDCATGADGRLPGVDEHSGDGLPGWGELDDQVVTVWSEDGAALPGPGNEGDTSGTKHDGGILVDAVERRHEGQQARPGQSDVPMQTCQFGLLGCGCGRGKLFQQHK